MLKTRIVPAHEESYQVCDFCNLEIKDYSYRTEEDRDGTVRHFHSMRAEGEQGVVKRSCIELWEMSQLLEGRFVCSCGEDYETPTEIQIHQEQECFLRHISPEEEEHINHD